MAKIDDGHVIIMIEVDDESYRDSLAKIRSLASAARTRPDWLSMAVWALGSLFGIVVGILL